MPKYSFDFKLQVVQDYYSGIGRKRFLSKKYGITPRQVAVWKNSYKEFGTLGLQLIHSLKHASIKHSQLDS
ncbi:helix-turn-helix domain-containing protein [Lactococcus chungangensis]|jgi:transposase-like protein|uniref:helix-turn-helix domain-containing protein n=1 Tax=Pseudolactococcus chungangensis TaxID=451457 RepID=UPI0036F30753